MMTIVSALALVTAIVAVWAATVLFADVPANPSAAMETGSSSINVMQMMMEAKSLPAQEFDTH